MSNYDIDVNVNITKGVQDLTQLQNFANKVGKDVMQIKQESLKNLRDTQRAATRTIIGIRGLFYAFGGSLDPFMQAILNIAASTIEMLYALATAEGSTILGLPAAAVHAGIALAIQAGTLPSILAGIKDAQTLANRAIAAVDAFAIFGGLT